MELSMPLCAQVRDAPHSHLLSPGIQKSRVVRLVTSEVPALLPTGSHNKLKHRWELFAHRVLPPIILRPPLQKHFFKKFHCWFSLPTARLNGLINGMGKRSGKIIFLEATLRSHTRYPMSMTIRIQTGTSTES